MYAVYYNNAINQWSVIHKDDADGAWYDHIPDAGTEQNAMQIADMLNNQE